MKTKIIIGLAVMLALSTRALEFKADEVPKAEVTVMYSLSEAEVIEAVKTAIKNKYPNADLTSPKVNFNAKTKYVTTNTCPHVSVSYLTNWYELKVVVQPTIVVPTENHNWVPNIWFGTNNVMLLNGHGN